MSNAGGRISTGAIRNAQLTHKIKTVLLFPIIKT